MEIKLLSEDPHSESDILSDTPIKYQVGDFKLIFPMPSYKQYIRFEKGVKALGLDMLLGKEADNAEIQAVKNEIMENLPGKKLLIRGLGLPYFVAQFVDAKSDYIKDYLLDWRDENPTKTSNYDLETVIGVRLTLSDWMANNLTLPECMEIFNSLIFLFSTIKKKALALMMREKKTKTEQPPSQVARMAVESLRKKRLQRAHSS